MSLPLPHSDTYRRYILMNGHIPAPEAAQYLATRDRYQETDQLAALQAFWKEILPARVLGLIGSLYRRVRLDKQTWTKRERVRVSYAQLARENAMSVKTVERILHRASAEDIDAWQTREVATAWIVRLLQAQASLPTEDAVAEEYGLSLADVRAAYAQAERWVATRSTAYVPVSCPWQEGDFTYTYRGQTYELGGQVYTFNDLLRRFIRAMVRSVYTHHEVGHPVYGDMIFEVPALLPLPPTERAAQVLGQTWEDVRAARTQMVQQAEAIQQGQVPLVQTFWPDQSDDIVTGQSPRSMVSTKKDLSITRGEESLPIALSATGKTGRLFPVGAETIGSVSAGERDQTRNGYERDGEQTNRIEQGTPPPLRATPPMPTVGKLLTAEEMDREAWLALARDEAGLAIATNYAALLYPRLNLLSELRSEDGEKPHPLQNLYLAKGEDDGDGDRYDGRQWYPATEDAPAEARTWWEIRKDIRSAVEQVLAAHAPHDGTKGTLPKHLAQLADRAKKKTDQYGAGIRGSRHGYYLTCLKNARREYQMKRGKMDELVKADAKGIVHGAARRDGVIVSLKAKPGRLPFGNGI